MTNRQNEWKQTRKRPLINLVSPNKHGCQYRGCGEKRQDHLEFEHIHQTKISRTGSREMKSKFADINAHPEAYKVSCYKHRNQIPGTAEHDARMRKLGRR